MLDYCSSDHWPCWTTDTPHQTIFVGLLTLWTIGWNSHPFKYSRVPRVFIDFWKYVCREYEMTFWNSYTRLSCTFVLGSCSKELTPETEWQKEPRIKESSENRCHGISSATSDDDVNVWDSETLGNREGKYAKERGETLYMSASYMHGINLCRTNRVCTKDSRNVFACTVKYNNTWSTSAWFWISPATFCYWPVICLLFISDAFKWENELRSNAQSHTVKQDTNPSTNHQKRTNKSCLKCILQKYVKEEVKTISTRFTNWRENSLTLGSGPVDRNWVKDKK